MKPWLERSFESRNLFNPAFCGVVLLRAMLGYETNDPEGIPFSLALLILPLCLHKESREAINHGKLSYLIKITEDNPHILVGFPGRTRSLLPYTLEGLGFIMQRGSFTVGLVGRLRTVPRCVKGSITGTEESRACQSAARALGKKFATVDRVTIYTTFGIRP